MRLGKMVALFADVHGASGSLERALGQCRELGVSTVALLGDLIDRAEQADACAAALAGWDVVGVYGNHEREIALAASELRGDLREETVQLLLRLEERIEIDDVVLTHEVEHWGQNRLFDRIISGRDGIGRGPVARITFAGHTHYRHARDEHGPIDIARGQLAMNDRRRYLINPGALASGEYAVWDRDSHVVLFRRIDY